jgi:uncharacterized membrane protein
MRFIEWSVHGVELAGAAILVWGVVRALAGFLATEARAEERDERRRRLRRDLGFYLLFGLEVLVAADLLLTLLDPGRDTLITLGAIVLIRIAIGFSLERELRAERAA